MKNARGKKCVICGKRDDCWVSSAVIKWTRLLPRLHLGSSHKWRGTTQVWTSTSLSYQQATTTVLNSVTKDKRILYLTNSVFPHPSLPLEIHKESYRRYTDNNVYSQMYKLAAVPPFGLTGAMPGQKSAETDKVAHLRSSWRGRCLPQSEASRRVFFLLKMPQWSLAWQKVTPRH